MGTGLGIGLGLAFGGVTGSGSAPVATLLPTFAYQSETETLAAAMTVPPTARRKKTMDYTIRTLKDAGIWAKLKHFWHVGTDQQSSLLNWKDPTKSMTLQGAPTFAANLGFTGSATAALKSGIFLDDLPLDSASMAIFSTATSALQIANDAGAMDSTGAGLSLSIYTSTNKANARAMGPVTTDIGSASVWSGFGFGGVSRTVTTELRTYKGPEFQAAPANTSAASALGHVELYFCGANNNGAIAASTRRQSGGAIGTGLTDAEMVVLGNVMQEIDNRIQQGEYDTYMPATAPEIIDGYDAIVYGTTSMAMAHAWELFRQGKKPLIVGGWRDWEINIGSMSSTGLGQTDFVTQSALGGLPRWILARMQTLGGKASNVWPFEPRRMYTVLRSMFDPRMGVQGYDIPIVFSNGVSAVTKVGDRITSITTVDGRTFKAKYFADASFEGDLMKVAGTTVRYGREAAGTGGESINGFTGDTAALTFQITYKNGTYMKVDPWRTPGDTNSGLLPNIEGILNTDSPPNGSADNRSQAFNFRMTITNSPVRKVAFPTTAPIGWDPLIAEPMLRRLAIDPTLALTDLFIFNTIATNVFDLNAQGAWSSDLPGGSTGYLQLTYAQREARWKYIWNYHMGLWWTFQYSTDTRVPAAVRTSALTYGFDMLHYTAPHPNDGYNTTPSLYVREGYRVEGDTVFDANYFLQTDGTTPSSIKTISTASYNFDSHDTTAWARFASGVWAIWSDGSVGRTDTGGADRISPVPYEAHLPKRAECTNLCQLFGGSYTHISFSTVRMEFTLMQVAQSMAVAAALAIENGNQALHDVDYTALRTRLLATPSLSGEVAPVLPQVN